MMILIYFYRYFINLYFAYFAKKSFNILFYNIITQIFLESHQMLIMNKNQYKVYILFICLLSIYY